MRAMTTVLFLAILCASGPIAASPLVHQWSGHYGDTNPQTAAGVATDAAGNVYVAGTFYGTIDLGNGMLVSAGMSDIFLAKFDPLGSCVWSKRFGDTDVQSPQAIAVDAGGNIYLCGAFASKVDFGGGSLTSAGNYDVFLAKFDTDGVHQWSMRFGDTDEQESSSVAVDGSGNVFLAGHFLGSINLGGGAFASMGGYDAYLAKFDGTGTYLWSKHFGDTGDQTAGGVATDPSGNVVMTGTYSGTVDFGGGPLAASGDDVFLVKLDPSGTHVWSHRYGDSSGQSGTSVATDAAGNIYLAADVAGSVDFGGGTLTSAGGSDNCLVKFDANAVHQWSHIWGDLSDQGSARVAVGPTGNVYLGGTLSGTVDFGGGPLVTQGVWDIFLAAFDNSGVHQWSQRFGDSSKYQLGTGVATDASDNVILTGFFQGKANFGGGTLTATGSYDVFLAKFGHTPTAVGASPGAGGLSISAYPNPFNPETTIRYTVPSTGRVIVTVYDARGARVATLVDGERGAGAYTEAWNGLDGAGRGVSSGVYFARVTHASGTKSYKMVLLR